MRPQDVAVLLKRLVVSAVGTELILEIFKAISALKTVLFLILSQLSEISSYSKRKLIYEYLLEC